MLGLRQYKPCDAQTILSWIKSEEALRKWSSDRYGVYPVTEKDMNYKYMKCNGDCPDLENFYPFTAFDENGAVGHLIMRFTDDSKSVLRFGFVIVDDTKRGMGYGKEMLRLALKYAFEILNVQKVTLGVFENNEPAYFCYKAAGFTDVEMNEKELCEVCGQTWSVLEMEITRQSYLL